MKIPFTKAHGDNNDFLLTWTTEAPRQNLREVAVAICNRHTGIGADGWLTVTPGIHSPTGTDGSIRLFNSDGSDSEISGNGTRCAAAFLLDSGLPGTDIRIATGAGVKHLQLIGRKGLCYDLEMNMGAAPEADTIRQYALMLDDGPRNVIALNVGNPQCAVFVNDFDFDWQGLGRRIEQHPDFPNRTNVSFVKVIDPNTIDVRFWERGAGETLSSGTGSTGAFLAASIRGLVSSTVEVRTVTGRLLIRATDNIYLRGPAEIVAGGEFYWERE
jgi:diaminopimelate epimerase